tara:strand:- start:252 stop:545 length:294 start_codon:yes stop_codon:yes gene_type:complete
MIKAKNIQTVENLMIKMRNHFDNFFMISEEHGYDDEIIAVNLLQIATETIFDLSESPEEAKSLIYDMERFVGQGMLASAYLSLNQSKDEKNNGEASK